MLKKILAFALAGAMVIGSMSFNAFADSTGGAQSVDGSISITGLNPGDTVNVYKVLAWNQDWVYTSNFNTIAGSADILSRIKAHTWTETDIATITTKASSLDETQLYDTQTISGTTYTKTAPEAGMYIALVKSAKAGVVYNPIIISADYNSDNGTDTIPASSTILATSVAKKKDVTVVKTEPKITNDVGDTYSYKIETIIPTYSSAFTNTFFNISDTVSEYLDIDASSLTIKDGTGKTVTPTTKEVQDHKFTITFNHAYVSALQAPQALVIEYKAKLNVPLAELTNVKEEENEVTIEFPNNPNDLTGKERTALKDRTKEYTFSLDGTLFGDSDYQTGELVKVGKDSAGNILESLVQLDNGSKHAALSGAVFGLYTDKACQVPYSNAVFNGQVTTDGSGLMKIDGLDAGTYYLKEISAPDGYIKDQNAHTITITADIEDEYVYEYYTVNSETGEVKWYESQVANSIPYSYSVPVLKSYTVNVDGAESTYTMNLSGPSISSVTINESSYEVVNTKGVELPSTGGIGTTIFYAGGAVLVLLAGVLLVSKRRFA